MKYLLTINVKVDNGGAKRDRTADLLRARQALSQLSYSPNKLHKQIIRLNTT